MLPPPPTHQQRLANLKPSMTSRCLALFSLPDCILGEGNKDAAGKRNLNHPLPFPFECIQKRALQHLQRPRSNVKRTAT